MTRLFVYTRVFDKLWEEIGLTDEGRRDLEARLLEKPDLGTVIQGTGGLRKMRWAIRGKGKRGGIRILYVDFPKFGRTYLISLLSKSERENISETEKKQIRTLIQEIKSALEAKHEKEF